MARERITPPHSNQPVAENDDKLLVDENTQLHCIDDLRSELRSHTAASLHRGFQRQLVQKVMEVLHTSPSATLIINCVDLYFELLSASASSYDHLCFDTCLINMAKALKSTFMRTCSVSDKKQFEAIWKRLIILVQCNNFNLSDHSFVHLLVSAFVSILQHGSSSILQHGIAGINCLLNSSSAQLFVVNISYKAILPLVSQHLPVPNRKALIKVIIAVANRESHWLESEHHDHTSHPQHADLSGLPCPILRFLQIICVRAPEKTESRNDVAELIVQILLTRQDTHIRRYQNFLLKACCHSRSSVRLLSLQTLSSLRVNREEDDQSEEDSLTVLRTVCGRVNDRVANVRAKALSCILEILRSLSHHRFKMAFENLRTRAFECITSRTHDDKSRVRRNAVDLLAFICIQHITFANDCQSMDIEEEGNHTAENQVIDKREQLDIVRVCESVKQRCLDVSSVVRQNAMKHLTDVLLKVASSDSQRHLQGILRLWVEGVLPLLNDTDSRCQEVCLSNVNRVFLIGIGAGYSSIHETFSEKHLAEHFLREIGGKQEQFIELVRKMFITMCKKNAIGSSQLDYLSGRLKNQKEGLDERMRTGLWTVMEAISYGGKGKEVIRSLGQTSLVDEIVAKNNAAACSTAANLVRVMDSNTKRVLQAYCTKVLFPRLTFQESWKDSEFIRSVAKLLGKLSEEIGDELLEQCEAFIVENENGFDDKTALALLHIIGSACVSFRLNRTPPSAVVTFVEAMTSNVQTSSIQRAVAITTLGKLCLIEGFVQSSAPSQKEDQKDGKLLKSDVFGESLTRRLVSVFVHELDNATSSATRNNAVVVLCDLCRHYTAIVEPFIPRLATLLNDPSEFVRVQVISSLVDLLQQDYIKIRAGPLFYQIATGLLDSSDTVRSTAEYALLRVVSTKNPSLLAVSFIELVFVLNGCTDGGTFNNYCIQRKHTPALGLGDHSRRQVIYDVFLKGISLEHRLRLSGRFRTDIISNVLDEKLDFSKTSVEKVVEDVLSLLIAQPLNPFARLRNSNNNVVDEVCDEEVDKNERGSSQQNKHFQTKKSALMKKVQECELRDALIPCLLELRLFLEKRRSPTTKKVMECLCALLHTHRESLNTMIEDPVIRSEIEHQMLKGDEK
ncbi:unnamed protein product [Agarophyton chilense]